MQYNLTLLASCSRPVFYNFLSPASSVFGMKEFVLIEIGDALREQAGMSGDTPLFFIVSIFKAFFKRNCL